MINGEAKMNDKPMPYRRTRIDTNINSSGTQDVTITLDEYRHLLTCKVILSAVKIAYPATNSNYAVTRILQGLDNVSE